MSLETELRGMLRDVVREVVREELGNSRPTALQEELLTYEQVEQRFSISPRTLSRWVKEKKLKRYGKGKLTRVRAEDVKACLDQGNAPAAQPVADVKTKVTSILASLPGRSR
jgi:excisionase family DNA binding protein